MPPFSDDDIIMAAGMHNSGKVIFTLRRTKTIHAALVFHFPLLTTGTSMMVVGGSIGYKERYVRYVPINCSNMYTWRSKTTFLDIDR